MQKICSGWLLARTLILAALITSCGAPAREPAPRARVEATAQAVVTEAPATAPAPTATIGSSPEPAPSAVTLAAASAKAGGSSPTPIRTSTPAPTATSTTQPTSRPAPSPTPTQTATTGAALTVTAMSSATDTAVVAAEDLAAIGLQVYKDQFCGICHQLGAAGTGGSFGPTHDGLGSKAASRVTDQGYSGVATNAEEYIRESIVNPKAFIVPGYSITSHPMPSYDFLSEDQIRALVQMLLAQE